MGAFWNERFEAAKFKLRSVDDFVALFVDDPLAFRPGERFEYSNNGYVLLGALIERVAGGSYYDYVRGHIYKPAGMGDTDAYELDRDVPNLAIGYTRQGGDDGPEPGPRRNNLFLHSIRGGPAGGGYSTVGDLLRFGTALLHHRLLDADHTDAVLTGKVEMGRGSYGYGFMDERVGDHRVVGHGGGFPGVSTRFDLHLDRGYSVAVLSNYDPPAADRVAERVGELIPSV
jgi:CubicO group peptidase (beta-lactamase class C family)